MLSWKTKQAQIYTSKQKKNNIDEQENYFQYQLVNSAVKKWKRIEMKYDKYKIGDDDCSKIEPDTNNKIFC